MKKIEKILVGVDLSEYSTLAIEYAVEFAKASNAEILLLNVLNQRDINGVKMASAYYPNGIDLERYITDSKTERYNAIRALVKEKFFEVKSTMSIHVNMGVPFEEILNFAKDENIDLIVIGNKGRSNLSRTLFGSNAEKIFRHAKVPVVSVRDRDNFSRKS
ncbi:UspA7 [Desulforapulum autotrophicum HRM2]|jgi:nucleotide-binding universal stress UspA family protein|uniref:Universal stress protein n=1 Tax=Desulforapulum autotrophicum (strain ATCC 43914 / DSM 3382 / VKM B-1955 / HRM2) TaxID=177437 RepID=C0QC63_DESAH|nr:universal stress protein [Desulforapulum autotrophicum]ACN17080.1 UspA7 [Desulforapulum autotrophicum HRM2]